MQGELPSPGQPDLAWRIEENVKLLHVLAKEMGGCVAKIEAIQTSMQGRLESEGLNLHGTAPSNVAEFLDTSASEDDFLEAASGEGSVDRLASTAAWRAAAVPNLIAAGLVDQLQKELVLVVSFWLCSGVA